MIIKEILIKNKSNEFKKNYSIRKTNKWKELTQATSKLITYLMIMKNS